MPGNTQKYNPLMVLKSGPTLQTWQQFQGLFKLTRTTTAAICLQCKGSKRNHDHNNNNP